MPLDDVDSRAFARRRFGRIGFRLAVTVLVAAPLVFAVLALDDASAEMCRDFGSNVGCSSERSGETVLWVAVSVMAVVLLVGLGLLVWDLVRPREPSHDTSSHPRPASRNRKAITSIVFVVVAVGSAMVATVLEFGGTNALVGVSLALTLPMTMWATVFALRAKVEVRDADGFESGARTAGVVLAVGAALVIMCALAVAAHYI